MAEELISWFALGQCGDMVYIGEFATFEAADESMDTSPVWLVDEEIARMWLEQLKEMLE